MASNRTNADQKSGTVPWSYSLLPLIGSMLGIFTIVTCYILTSKGGRMPRGTTTPPISFLGCEGWPERTTYRIGFASCGISLALCIPLLWDTLIHPKLFIRAPRATKLARWTCMITCFGVIGQGVVLLESGLIQKLRKGDSTLSQESVIHQFFSLVFFLGAAIHCSAVTYAYFVSNDAIFRSWAMTGSKILKILLLITSSFSMPVAQAIHPAFAGGATQFDMAGAAQYVAAVSYIVFFATYSFDVLLLRQVPTSPPATTLANEQNNSRHEHQD